MWKYKSYMMIRTELTLPKCMYRLKIELWLAMWTHETADCAIKETTEHFDQKENLSN